jgi:hypothetical protein
VSWDQKEEMTGPGSGFSRNRSDEWVMDWRCAYTTVRSSHAPVTWEPSDRRLVDSKDPCSESLMAIRNAIEYFEEMLPAAK